MAYWFARPLDSNNHPRNDKDCVEKIFFNGVRCRMLWSMSEICQQAQGIISCTRHSSVLLIKATNEEWGEEGLRGCCAGDLRTAKGIPACCSAWRNGPLCPHTPAFLHSSGFESLSDLGVSCHQWPEPGSWAAWVLAVSRGNSAHHLPPGCPHVMLLGQPVLVLGISSVLWGMESQRH